MVLVFLMKADTTTGDVISKEPLLRSSSLTPDPLRKVERAPKSKDSEQPLRLTFFIFGRPCCSQAGKDTSCWFQLKSSSVTLAKEAAIPKNQNQTKKKEKKVQTNFVGHDGEPTVSQ